MYSRVVSIDNRHLLGNELEHVHHVRGVEGGGHLAIGPELPCQSLHGQLCVDDLEQPYLSLVLE